MQILPESSNAIHHADSIFLGPRRTIPLTEGVAEKVETLVRVCLRRRRLLAEPDAKRHLEPHAQRAASLGQSFLCLIGRGDDICDLSDRVPTVSTFLPSLWADFGASERRSRCPCARRVVPHVVGQVMRALSFGCDWILSMRPVTKLQFPLPPAFCAMRHYYPITCAFATSFAKP